MDEQSAVPKQPQTVTNGAEMTLPDFLLARIAEDEEIARSAGGEMWYAMPVPGPTMRKREDEEVVTIIDSPSTLISYEVVSDEVADHITRHGPDRVLAECEARRRIVEVNAHPARHDDGMWGEGARSTLQLLALPYSDHPDFREEWAA